MTVGVLGGSGGVGRAAARRLHALGVGPLRIGGRDLARLAGLAGELGAEAVAVDATDSASLDRFCAGCAVVLNCAGPARDILDRAALAAVRAGADYVDAAGDDPLYELLARIPLDGRRAVISAGMMPGLSGLLPRYLAAGLTQPTALTCYAGGPDRFTWTAAVDYLSALDGGYGEPLAAWRDGTRVSRALTALSDVELPYFPRRVSAQPYLSTEADRCARSLGLRELSWYTVFDGEAVPAALARARSRAREEAARELVRAAELDLFGTAPYQLFVLTMDGRTLVLRAGSATELTGVVAALATEAVLAGEIPPGLHHCAEVLPVDRVDRLGDGVTVELFDGDLVATEEEVGVL